MLSKKKAPSFLSKRGVGQIVTVTIGLIVICVAFGLINPRFMSKENMINLLRQTVPFIIIGIGQSYVLITGNIDLSIGSVVGMSCMISATLMSKGYGVGMGMLIAFIASITIGFLNGFLVSKCKLPPFIATLGTMSIARGVAQLVNKNHNTNAIQNADAFKNFFYYGKFLGIATSVWFTIVIFGIFYFIISQTRTGRHIYAVGSNIDAAALSGVNVFQTTTKAYIVSAFCAFLVGLIQTATSSMGSMDAGTSYEMYAVAASVIGGVSTLGGQGILVGTIVGAAIWSVLQNGLSMVGSSIGWKNIIIGIIVVISVFVDVLIRSGKLGRNKK